MTLGSLERADVSTLADAKARQVFDINLFGATHTGMPDEATLSASRPYPNDKGTMGQRIIPPLRSAAPSRHPLSRYPLFLDPVVSGLEQAGLIGGDLRGAKIRLIFQIHRCSQFYPERRTIAFSAIFMPRNILEGMEIWAVRRPSPRTQVSLSAKHEFEHRAAIFDLPGMPKF